MKIINANVSDFRFYSILFVLAVITSVCISFLGMIQFGGYDGSILINHAWQSEIGYKPYVDIVTGWPPALLIGAKYAFDLWGVRWASLVYIAALFSFVTFIYQVILLDKLGIKRVVSLCSVFAIQAVTMVVISWWWYNNVTAIIAVIFILSLSLLVKFPGSNFVWLNFVLASVLLLLSKPNVTISLIFLSICILLLSNRTRALSALVLAGSLLLQIALLALLGINFLDVIDSYSIYAVDSLTLVRIARFLLLNNYKEVALTFFVFLPCLLAFLLVVFSPLRELKILMRNLLDDTSLLQSVLIGLAGMIVGVWAMMTNNEYNMTDASIFYLGVLLVVHNLKNRASSSIPMILMLICGVAVAFNGWFFAVQRYRVMDVGPGAFFENVPLTRIDNPPLFEGVLASPRLVRVLVQIEQVLKESGYINRPDALVFFGPRIDFGYAAFGIYPYRGLPTWWEFFSVDGTKQTDDMVSRFKEANFQLCIFLKDDYTYMPQSILEYLDSQFTKYEKEDLTVYTQK